MFAFKSSFVLVTFAVCLCLFVSDVSAARRHSPAVRRESKYRHKSRPERHRGGYDTPPAYNVTSPVAPASNSTLLPMGGNSTNDAFPTFPSSNSSAPVGSVSINDPSNLSSVNVAAVTTTSPPSSAPSSTSSSLTPVPASGSGPSGSNGRGSYYSQGGAAGACGQVHSDSDSVVAIPPGVWGNTGGVSPYCGKTVSISSPDTGKTIKATVADLCPGCQGDNSLDLSIGAVSALAGSTDYITKGIYDINWTIE